MKRTPVASDSLASVGYDAETATLEIEFRNGYLYEYYLVPPEVYRELMSAESMGSFFTKRIKNKFPTRSRT